MSKIILLVSLFLLGFAPTPTWAAEACHCICENLNTGEEFDAGNIMTSEIPGAQSPQEACARACPQQIVEDDVPRSRMKRCEPVATTTVAPATPTGGPVVGFGNPLCPDPSKPCDPPTVIGNIIRALLGIVGSIALAMFIYGGFIWMIGGQRGAEKKVRYAKEIIVWSAAGLLVIFASYILVDFVIKKLTE